MQTLELSDYASTSSVTLEALAALAMHVASEPTRVAFGVGAGISTAAGIPDFRGGATSLYGANSVRHPTRGHSTLDDTRLTTTRTAARTKELSHYDALLRQESRADHLRMMATLRKAAKRATRKGKERATSDGAADGPEGAPTAFHGLMKRVTEKGRLARVYSQNIDGLEAAAGLTSADSTLTDGKGTSRDAHPRAEQDDSSSDFDRPRRKTPRRRASGPAPSIQDLPVVTLHGSLDHVLCGVCLHREQWKKRHTKAYWRGKTVPCPKCHNRAQSRILRSKRAIEPAPLAFLRPAVVLYDDPSFASSAAAQLISSTVEADLKSQPACLIVAGTSLRIPGFRSLVKEFSRAVRRNGGWSILVNREAVGKEWDSFFDYYFSGDTEVFAKHLTAFLDCFLPDPVSTLRDPPPVLASALPAVAQTPTVAFRALSPLSALLLPPTPPSSAHSPLPPEPQTYGERIPASLKRTSPPAVSPIKVPKKRKKGNAVPAFEGADTPEAVRAEEAASMYPSPPPSSQLDLGPAPHAAASSPAEVEVFIRAEEAVAQPCPDQARKYPTLGPLSIAEVLRHAEKQVRRRRRAEKRARASASSETVHRVAA